MYIKTPRNCMLYRVTLQCNICATIHNQNIYFVTVILLYVRYIANVRYTTKIVDTYHVSAHLCTVSFNVTFNQQLGCYTPFQCIIIVPCMNTLNTIHSILWRCRFYACHRLCSNMHFGLIKDFITRILSFDLTVFKWLYAHIYSFIQRATSYSRTVQFKNS